MEDKNRSNDEVYEEWMDYIKKRNNFYKKAKTV